MLVLGAWFVVRSGRATSWRVGAAGFSVRCPLSVVDHGKRQGSLHELPKSSPRAAQARRLGGPLLDSNLSRRSLGEGGAPLRQRTTDRKPATSHRPAPENKAQSTSHKARATAPDLRPPTSRYCAKAHFMIRPRAAQPGAWGVPCSTSTCRAVALAKAERLFDKGQRTKDNGQKARHLTPSRTASKQSTKHNAQSTTHKAQGTRHKARSTTDNGQRTQSPLPPPGGQSSAFGPESSALAQAQGAAMKMPRVTITAPAMAAIAIMVRL